MIANVKGRGWRTIIGIVLGFTDVCLVFAGHVFTHGAFTRDEVFMHVGLLVAAYALLSKNGFQDIADAYKTWKQS